MDIGELYQFFLQHPSVQTDTRKLQKGDIFFALKGEHFNGNLFAKKAIEEGASLVVMDERSDFQDKKIIHVEDSLLTLQQLSAFHRSQFKIPFLSITGSNGKTTTKELIHAVLSMKYKTYTTPGNFNNHIGIPLTLLKIKQDAEMAVVEMGANHQHEIEGYCRYAQPDYGLITNIGKAHLEGFGGQEGVKKGKGELFRYIAEHDGTVFVNSDDARVADESLIVKNRVLYGAHENGCQTEIVSRDPFLMIRISGDNPETISTRLVGDYNLHNILAAVAVGRYFDVSDQQIVNAIEAYTPSNSRSQLIKAGSNTIIMDAYNANPSSMSAAIKNFAAIHAERKVLILGDMKELGESSLSEHRKIVDLIRQYPWYAVALTGPAFSSIAHPFYSFKNTGETKAWYVQSGFSNVSVLIKGSHSMQMDRVIDRP